MIGLPKGEDHHRTVGQFRMSGNTLMNTAVEQDVFIDLVTQDQDLGSVRQLFQRFEIGCIETGTGRVVRSVDDDHSRARTDGLSNLLPIDFSRWQLQLHIHRQTTGEFDRRYVAIISGFDHDHFVTGANDRRDSRVDRLCATAGDGDFGIGMIACAIQGFHLFRDAFTQDLHARHWRILVEPIPQIPVDAFNDLRGNRIVRKPLREVDGLMLLRQRRHHREDGRPDIREF